MSDARWRHMATIMMVFGLVPESFDPKTAYTLRFTQADDLPRP
jgi:hypothetical protein